MKKLFINPLSRNITFFSINFNEGFQNLISIEACENFEKEIQKKSSRKVNKRNKIL